MWVLLAAWTCWTATASPLQELPAELAARDAARVHIAREAHFAERWSAASDEQREAARARLLELRSSRAPSITTSIDRAANLAQAWRLLLGGPSPAEEGGALASLADALDLRVAPGGFAARDEGLGEAMTVHVRLLFDAAIDAPVELTLLWRSLADGAEERARSEPVAPEAFTRDGFQMYVRPPAAAPGRFELVPELASGAARARGFPTVVDCAAELERRARALDELAERGFARAYALRAELAPRLVHGMRTLDAFSAEDALRLVLEDGEPATPVRIVAPPDGLGAALLWSRAGVDAPRARVVLIACAEPEHPTDVLCGASGAAWEELARALDAQLLATDLPARALQGSDLLQLLRALRAGGAIEELSLVARGTTAVLLPPRLRRPENAALVDRLLVHASQASRRTPRFDVPLPLLSIDALAPEAALERGGTEPGTWCWVRRPEPECALEPEVPALLAAWIAGELDEAEARGERAPR